jgi:hypothetical protein
MQTPVDILERSLAHSGGSTIRRPILEPTGTTEIKDICLLGGDSRHDLYHPLIERNRNATGASNHIECGQEGRK